MGREERIVLLALGILLLVSTPLAQQENQESGDKGENLDHHDAYTDSDNEDGYQDQNQQRSYDEQLSLVEYELFDMSPAIFTIYGEDFVDSVNQILKTQYLNSSVVGVLVSDQEYEESTMVATIIVSYYNETILSQLGDLETYIASYITDKRDQLSVEAIRIASVHSRKVSSLSSDSEVYQRGWVFVAGSSPSPDSGTESEVPGSYATVRYQEVEFSVAHGHSFGYGVKKKRSTENVRRSAGREVAEFDDDFLEWYKFRVFHSRNGHLVSDNTQDWKSLTWTERSLQQTAETTWSKRESGRMGKGAIAGIVTTIVLSAGIIGLMVSGYLVVKRLRKRKQLQPLSPASSLVNIGSLLQGSNGVTEQTALV